MRITRKGEEEDEDIDDDDDLDDWWGIRVTIDKRNIYKLLH